MKEVTFDDPFQEEQAKINPEMFMMESQWGVWCDSYGNQCILHGYPK